MFCRVSTNKGTRKKNLPNPACIRSLRFVLVGQGGKVDLFEQPYNGRTVVCVRWDCVCKYEVLRTRTTAQDKLKATEHWWMVTMMMR